MKTAFYESLYNFDSLIDLTLDAFEHHDKLQILPGSALGRDTMSITYLRLCVMIEEIKIINSFCKIDANLKAIMTHLKPFIDYAKQYEKGFNEMRNSAYAHFNRDKNGKFRPFWTTIDKIEVPRSEGELRFICGGLSYVRDVLIKNYSDYKEFKQKQTDSFSKQIDALNKNFIAKTELNLGERIRETNEKLKTNGFIH